MRPLVLASVSFFFLSGTAAVAAGASPGPSFDCTKARSSVEVLICGDARLSAQDALMADLYRTHLAQAGTDEERTARVDKQRAWNRNRVAECRLESGGPAYESAADCVGNLYASRIVDLHQTVTPAPPDGLLDRAMALAAVDPTAADALLADHPSVIAMLDRMLYLHAFATPSPQSDARIEAIKREVDDLTRLALDAYTLSMAEELVPYDRGDTSLAHTLRAVVQSGLAMWGVPYLIPCDVLQRRPGLLAATEPFFGGNRDNFLPRSGCGWGRGSVEGFPRDTVRAFVEAATVADGDFIDTYEGTMRFTIAAAQAAAIERLALHPGDDEVTVTPAPMDPQERPYHVWSYLAVANHRAWPPIDAAYEAAHQALSDFMVAQGWFPDRLAAGPAARERLFDAVLGADCGGAKPPRSLRTLVLDGADTGAIQAFIAAGDWQDPDRLEPFSTCAGNDAGRDPLIHLAVTRPDLLDILSKTASGVDADIAATLDLEMGVQATNGFGKTPLMSAAQWDSIGGIDWLLARGADVHATSVVGEEWERPRHGARTALMYAAAGASLPVIRRLLEAGADRSARDSRGLAALDYLTGKGPVPRNPRLSEAEFAEAERLLR